MLPAAIFDTNGLVSAALLSQSVSRQAFEKAYKHCRMLTSTVCLDELAEVLYRPKFAKYVTPFEASLFINRYTSAVQVVPITVTITDCRDVKDNKFLEVAVSAKADYLVTGDADLLILHPYGPISIISPGDFLQTSMDIKT